MGHKICAWVCWAILLLAPLCLCPTARASPAIVAVRLGLHPGSTRIVLELSEPAAYRVGLLAGPPRLYVELPESDWSGLRLPAGLGQVAKVAMTTSGGITRLTAALRGGGRIGGVQLIAGMQGADSRRLVIDVMPATASEFSAGAVAEPIDSNPSLVITDAAVPGAPAPGSAAPSNDSSTAPPPANPLGQWSGITPLLKPVSDGAIAPAAPNAPNLPSSPAILSSPPAAKLILASASTASTTGAISGPTATASIIGWPPGVPVLRPAPTALPMVYIDPGHGGPDPGTIGHDGAYEKNITLAVAQELQRQLVASGRYRVKLTRIDDRFVALRERFELARLDHADLFISLHADSSFVGDPRGASIYTLSETSSDAEAAALAAKENKADLIAGVDLSKQNVVVTSILIDLAQRETKNLSARFAERLVEELRRVTVLLPNSHRYAGFAVLKAPDIPSVLIELGYLSNGQDEALLLSAAHRAKLAAAMLRAIDGYFTVTVASGRS
jgi:N-acetylmuramoyl-L-alanine amidase